MRNYRTLYRFRAWAIAFVIAVFGIAADIAGQVDSVGRILLWLIVLAAVVRGFVDGIATNNRVEADYDRELTTAQLVFLLLLYVVCGGGFVVYALTR